MDLVHRDGSISATDPTGGILAAGLTQLNTTPRDPNAHFPTQEELDAKEAYQRITADMQRYQQAISERAKAKQRIIQLLLKTHSQQQVADLLGISKGRVWQLAKGR